MQMNRNTHIIIFDFDGTLADTRQIIVNTQQQTMRKLHLPVPAEQESMATIGPRIHPDNCFFTFVGLVA